MIDWGVVMVLSGVCLILAALWEVADRLVDK
jgi:hypothetical protein